MEYSVLDLLVPPVFLFIIFFFAIRHRQRKELREAYYKYYTSGLAVKLVGSVALCLVYTFYYKGGDTTLYFKGSLSLLKLAEKDFGQFLEVMFKPRTPETYSYFDKTTGWPGYWWDNHSFFVVKVVTLFSLLGFKSFIGTAMLLAWASFSGVWKLYQLFARLYPQLSKELAISILFIPGVFFWGSGILKDTITISCVGWYAWAFYEVLIKKRFGPGKITALIISSWLMLSVKPYILFALLPGSTIWLATNYATRIQSKTLRNLFLPTMIGIGLGLGFLILANLQSSLGDYNFDNILQKAVASQQDQKQDYYGGNSFDIGEFDPTIPSMLGKAHAAIAAALFRPYLWDVRNPVMFLSSLENTYILLLTVFLLFRLRFFGFFKIIGKDSLLLFSFLFALFFAFSVGISISNFGTLVRLKIPGIPFFVASLFLIRYYYEKQSGKKLGI